jgi:hypothetical protein
MSVAADGAVETVPVVNATEVMLVFAPLVANPVIAPPRVKLPEPVTVPDSVKPLTVPVPLTEVTLPLLGVTQDGALVALLCKT